MSRPKNKTNLDCIFCNKPFSQLYILEIHLRTHTLERPVNCKICGKDFPGSANLISHRKLHSGENRFKCPFCIKRFSNSSNCRVHIVQVHTGEKHFRCELCGKRFNANGTLVGHIKRVHNKENNDNVQCVFCPVKRASISDMEVHLRSHSRERPFFCNLCEIGTVSGFSLKCHKRIHDTGRSRNYQCDLCKKSFFTLGHLKEHLLCHSDQRKFKCDVCEATFKTKRILVKHNRVHKVLARDFQCTECNKTYTCNGHLQRHLREAVAHKG